MNKTSRPAGVTACSIAYLGMGAVIIISVFMQSNLLSPALGLMVGVASIIAGIGMFSGRRWAWFLALFWPVGMTIVNIATDVTSLNAIAVISRALMLIYLLTAGPRRYFSAGPARAAAPAKYRRQLERVQQFTAEKQFDKALALAQTIIRELTRPALSGVTSEHRECLGQAYLEMSYVQDQQGARADSVNSLLEARKLVKLPPAALTFLSRSLATQSKQDEQAEAVYLDYVRQRAGQPAPADDPTYALLARLCRVEEDAESKPIAAIAARCRRVLEADTNLDWAHYNLGLALGISGAIAEAVQQMEAAARLAPTRLEAQYYLRVYRAILFEQQSEPVRAQGLLREAIAGLPERPEAHFFLARSLTTQCDALAQTHQHDAPARILALATEAVASAGRAATLRPRRADYQFYHGRACALAGDSRGAVAAYRRAIALQNDVKDYHLHLAGELGKLGELHEALKAAERAVALAPRDIQCCQTWADLSAQAGQHDDAVQRYQRTLQLDANYLPARLGLSRVLYILGRYKEAGEALESIQNRSKEAAFLLARCCAHQEQFARAAQLLTNLVTEPNAGAEVFYHLGNAYANQGQFAPAVEAFDKALRRDPKLWQAHLGRGHVRFLLGELDKAAQDYECARSAQPANPDVVVALARCQMQQGNHADALAHLQRVLESQPAHWDANMLAGALAETAKDFARAEQAYRAALHAQPDRIEAQTRLGLLYSHSDRASDAGQALERAAREGDQSDALLFHLGLTRANTGNYAGALEAWTRLYERHTEDERLALNIRRISYLLGRQHFEAGRYQEAGAAWQSLLETRAEDERLRQIAAEAHFRQALTALDGEARLPEARQELLAATQLDETHAGSGLYLAIMDLLDGQPASAAQRLEAQNRNADLPALVRLRARYYRGLAFLKMGDYAGAAGALQGVLDDPLHDQLGLPADWALAAAHVRQERWTQALSALQHASA